MLTVLLPIKAKSNRMDPSGISGLSIDLLHAGGGVGMFLNLFAQR